MRDLIIPDLGEGVDEGTVIAIRVGVGETIEPDQIVLDVETDKVTLEIPSALAGVIREICVATDAAIRPGDVFARLEPAAADTANPAPPPAPDAEAEVVRLPTPLPASAAERAPTTTPFPPSADPAPHRGARVKAGPAARREARQLGADITSVRGTGRRGAITKDDVRRHVRGRLTASGEPPVAGNAPVPLPDLASFGPVRRVAMTRIEQATARAMDRAARVIPHAWIVQHADVTELERARRAFRAEQSSADAPLTMTAVLCRVVALALTRCPRFNAAIDEQTHELVYRDYVNVGVAVDSERGLVVPVIRNASDLSIGEIALELSALAAAARENSLDAGQLRGAGITITNLGGIGVTGIQPIVNWPEVAIIGVASLDEYPAACAGGIAWRLRLPLTLGFDHRVINGADAARFLNHVTGMLSNPVQLAFFR